MLISTAIVLRTATLLQPNGATTGVQFWGSTSKFWIAKGAGIADPMLGNEGQARHSSTAPSPYEQWRKVVPQAVTGSPIQRRNTSAPCCKAAAPAAPVNAGTNAGIAPRRFHSPCTAWNPR